MLDVLPPAIVARILHALPDERIVVVVTSTSFPVWQAHQTQREYVLLRWRTLAEDRADAATREREEDEMGEYIAYIRSAEW